MQFFAFQTLSKIRRESQVSQYRRAIALFNPVSCPFAMGTHITFTYPVEASTQGLLRIKQSSPGTPLSLGRRRTPTEIRKDSISQPQVEPVAFRLATQWNHLESNGKISRWLLTPEILNLLV